VGSPVSVRCIPLVPAAYGTRMAQPARTTLLARLGDYSQHGPRVRPVLGDHCIAAKSPKGLAAGRAPGRHVVMSAEQTHVLGAVDAATNLACARLLRHCPSTSPRAVHHDRTELVELAGRAVADGISHLCLDSKYMQCRQSMSPEAVHQD
jgi:hypothetical protein